MVLSNGSRMCNRVYKSLLIPSCTGTVVLHGRCVLGLPQHAQCRCSVSTRLGKSLLELPSPNKSYYLRVLIALTRDLDCAKNNDVSSVDVFQFHPDAISANGP